jgi:hypothetical protein
MLIRIALLACLWRPGHGDHDAESSSSSSPIAHVWAGVRPVASPSMTTGGEGAVPLWALEDDGEVITGHALPLAEAINGALVANVLSADDCAYVIDLCERRGGFQPSPQKQTGDGISGRKPKRRRTITGAAKRGKTKRRKRRRRTEDAPEDTGSEGEGIEEGTEWADNEEEESGDEEEDEDEDEDGSRGDGETFFDGARTSHSCPLLWGGLYGDPARLRSRFATQSSSAAEFEGMLEELEAVRALEQRLARVLNVTAAHLEPLQIVR